MESEQNSKEQAQSAQNAANGRNIKAKRQMPLSRAKMLRYMSRFKVKKQPKIRPRTFVNTQGLSTARLQPSAAPEISKPIISNNVKARIESDLNFLLENQKMIPARVRAPESYISLKIHKTRPADDRSADDDGRVGDEEKTDHEMKTRKRKAVSQRQAAHQPGIDHHEFVNFHTHPDKDKTPIYGRSGSLFNSTKKSISQNPPGPPIGSKSANESNVRHVKAPKADKRSNQSLFDLDESSYLIPPSSLSQPKYGSKKRTATITATAPEQYDSDSLFDFNPFESQIEADFETPTSLRNFNKVSKSAQSPNFFSPSVFQKNSQSAMAKNKSHEYDGESVWDANARFDKTPIRYRSDLSRYSEKSNRRNQPERTITSKGAGQVSAHYSNTKSNRSRSRVDDQKSNYSGHSSRSNRPTPQKIKQSPSFDYNTVDDRIRAGFGTQMPTLPGVSSDFFNKSMNDDFNAKNRGWSVDEPTFTEPPSVSPSRFEFRPSASRAHFDSKSQHSNDFQLLTADAPRSSNGRAKMTRTRITKSSMSRVGESPFMEQIVIQRMKY